MRDELCVNVINFFRLILSLVALEILVSSGSLLEKTPNSKTCKHAKLLQPHHRHYIPNVRNFNIESPTSNTIATSNASNITTAKHRRISQNAARISKQHAQTHHTPKNTFQNQNTQSASTSHSKPHQASQRFPTQTKPKTHRHMAQT